MWVPATHFLRVTDPAYAVPMHRSPLRSLVVSLVSLAGCAGSLSDPQRFYAAVDAGRGTDAGALPPNCDAPTTVFAPSCLVCHAPPNPLGALDLSGANVAQRLVNVKSAACSGQVLVVAGQPDASYLLQKLVEAQPACGAQMPQRGALSSTAVECVTNWISNLAIPDGGSSTPPNDAGGT